MPKSREKFSLAVVEIIPIGGSSERGVRINPRNEVGQQSSDYIFIPRVLDIVEPNSNKGRALRRKYPTDLSARFSHGGIRASLIKLYQKKHYIAYKEDAMNRGAYYVSRIHGVNDGHLGSVGDETLPTAVSHRSPKN